MRKVPIALGAMLVALIVPDLVHAQWLNYPSAGIPRTGRETESQCCGAEVGRRSTGFLRRVALESRTLR